MAEGSYFLASGTISKTTLNASSTNNIENFPLQSDQTYYGSIWTPPEITLTKRPKPARITEAANLGQFADGFYEFEWGFPYWTTGQLAYYLNTFFGGADIYTTMSLAVTAQTLMDSVYVCFNCLMYRPVWGDSYKSEDGGFTDVILRFRAGSINNS